MVSSQQAINCSILVQGNLNMTQFTISNKIIKLPFCHNLFIYINQYTQRAMSPL